MIEGMFENTLKRAIDDISRRLQSMQVFIRWNGDDQIYMTDISAIGAYITLYFVKLIHVNKSGLVQYVMSDLFDNYCGYMFK